MLYQKIQMKDFVIHDVSERWFERYRNFDGTFADTRFSDIYETSLDVEYNSERYRLSLRLDREQLGDLGSIRDEEGEGRGISSEILVYIIRELTNEEKSVLQEFVNGLSELNLSDEVSLFVYDENNNELGKAYFGRTMGDELMTILNNRNQTSTAN